VNDTLLVEKRDRVTLLTINRPQVRNALDDGVAHAIREAILVCEDDGTRCMVLTGAGGAFSSGADIKKAMAEGITPESIRKLLVEGYHPTLKAIRAAPWPVIAAVDGYAAGIGCDFALACDLRLVSERARFAELFARVGLIPDGGGTYMLPRLVGLGRAMELMLTGRDVHAEEAMQIGLANQVLPVENFREAVIHFASELAKQSPHALKRGKAAMLAALDSNYSDSLAREAQFQTEIFAQPDGSEGFQAFVEKREPVWK
jgi:2-(1,2-epoxy-1,2-dihydrophenyl)acetyl-CoA isomerase